LKEIGIDLGNMVERNSKMEKEKPFPDWPLLISELYTGIFLSLDTQLTKLCKDCDKISENKKIICRTGKIFHYMSKAFALFPLEIARIIAEKIKIEKIDKAFLTSTLFSNLITMPPQSLSIWKVEGNSMAPAMNEGDIAVAGLVFGYKDGDIILKPLSIDENISIWKSGKLPAFFLCHRLIHVYEKDGVTYFVTKGDNASEEDDSTPDYVMPFAIVTDIIKKGTSEHKLLTKLLKKLEEISDERREK